MGSSRWSGCNRGEGCRSKWSGSSDKHTKATEIQQLHKQHFLHSSTFLSSCTPITQMPGQDWGSLYTTSPTTGSDQAIYNFCQTDASGTWIAYVGNAITHLKTRRVINKWTGYGLTGQTSSYSPGGAADLMKWMQSGSSSSACMESCPAPDCSHRQIDEGIVSDWAKQVKLAFTDLVQLLVRNTYSLVPRPFPLINMHTASDQILVVGMAWEWSDNTRMFIVNCRVPYISTRQLIVQCMQLCCVCMFALSMCVVCVCVRAVSNRCGGSIHERGESSARPTDKRNIWTLWINKMQP